MSLLVGITQGRLVPMVDGQIQRFPASAWQEELALVAPAGFDGVEWIHDEFGQGMNPLSRRDGHRAIAAACARASTRVLSGCFDDLLNGALWEHEDRWAPVLSRIAQASANLAALGATHMVIPLLRDNDVRDTGMRSAAGRFVKEVLRVTAPDCLEIHLETALPSGDLRRFLEQVGDERCRVTFDTGNLPQFGYDSVAELKPVLPLVGSVHVKDAILNGGTVPLGTGVVDFTRILGELLRFDYRGTLIVQAARIANRSDVDLCRSYREFVGSRLTAASGSVGRPVALEPKT